MICPCYRHCDAVHGGAKGGGEGRSIQVFGEKEKEIKHRMIDIPGAPDAKARSASRTDVSDTPRTLHSVFSATTTVARNQYATSQKYMRPLIDVDSNLAGAIATKVVQANRGIQNERQRT